MSARSRSGDTKRPPVATPLPDLSREEFRRRLVASGPGEVVEGVLDALFVHYAELRRWSRRSSLIGPGTAEEVVERHYAESLWGATLVRRRSGVAVDLGSGAGFPGWVLAAALRGFEFTLVEPRQRKWAFLAAASRAASLPCTCLDARVGRVLPEGFPPRVDLVTARAIQLSADVLESLGERLVEGGSILLWAGEEPPGLPPGLAVTTERRLPRAERRRILELRPTRRDPP